MNKVVFQTITVAQLVKAIHSLMEQLVRCRVCERQTGFHPEKTKATRQQICLRKFAEQ
jgi:hypothetical protein